MNNPLRLLLVDDHYVVRMGLVASLNLEANFEVVAEAESIREAVELYEKVRPDVVVIDWRLPDGSGDELIKKIRALDSHAKILVLSAFESEEIIFLSVQAGAAGYLAKSSRRPELIQAVRSVGAGESLYSASMAAKLLQRMQRPELSPRELDVIAELVKGNSNKEIGTLLGISENTVKIHITHIMAKLRAKDRTHVASLAIQKGIVS